MGLNGAEGAARAKAAFFGGPGYQANLDTAIDALNRRRNAAGSLVSGNADADAIKLGSDYANNTWQAWLAGLSPYNNLNLSAATGAADAGKTLGNLGVTEANFLNEAGRAKAGVATGQGNSLADIANRYFGGLAGFDTAEGGALAGNATNAANALNSAALNIAPQIGQTFKEEAAAEMAGSKAFWEALMGGANLALKASGVGGFGAPSFNPGGTAAADPFRKGFATPSQRR